MAKYSYFNNKDYEFQVTKETLELTPYTFCSNAKLWETNSINFFYKDIVAQQNKDKSYNIIDIGAQSGLYTLFAKFIPKSTFYAFEPFPSSFKLLNDNIKLNNIDNVKTYNIGISDKIGETTLNVCNSHNGLHTIGENVKRFNDISKITIKTDTIDNLFYDKDIPVDYIKIDTEGWEYHILNGAKNTIKKYKPKLQIEWNLKNMEQCNVTPKDLIKLFNELKYKAVNKIDEELFLEYNYS